MIMWTRLLVGGFAFMGMIALGSRAHAADRPKTQWSSVEFSVQPRDITTHAWTVRLNASGSGRYSETDAGEQPLLVNQATILRITHGEHRVRAGRCETRQKRIADTGQKTIRYTSPDGEATCTFNFSDDAELMDAAEAFMAIAETMQAGERLQHDLRYDRLSLDAEMDQLLDRIKDGAAIEIANIAPVLQALVQDDHVIDRVRRKAARLLQDSGAAAGASDLTSSAR